MYEEEFDDLKFNVNRGRDAFIEQVLNVIEVVSDSEKKEISDLLDI